MSSLNGQSRSILEADTFFADSRKLNKMVIVFYNMCTKGVGPVVVACYLISRAEFSSTSSRFRISYRGMEQNSDNSYNIYSRQSER